MAQGYLTQAQLEDLKSLIGRRVVGIEECHWRSEDEVLLDYLTLNFNDRGSIVLRVGSTAEDVDLIAPDELEAELEGRDRSMFVRTVASDNARWGRMLGETVLDVVVKDETGYSHSSITFVTAIGPTEIATSADALTVILP